MTSPCSVSLKRPSMDPGGRLSTARRAGPPPRPMDPPRPWKIVSATPCSCATAVSRCCARYSAKDAVSIPASLLESESPIITSCAPPRSARYRA